MSCNVYQTVRSVKLSKKHIVDIVEATLKDLGKSGNEVSVHVIGDKKMKRINRDYRDMDRTTDVLAFAMQEGKKMDSEDLGDIFISVAQVQRQAKRQKISFQEEFARVLIHGVLHLNGYDHATKKEENIMFPLQEKIVKKMVK